MPYDMTMPTSIDEELCSEADITGLFARHKLVVITELVKANETTPPVYMPLMTYAALERKTPVGEIERLVEMILGRTLHMLTRNAGPTGKLPDSWVMEEVYPGGWVILQLMTDIQTNKKAFVLGFLDDMAEIGISTPSRKRAPFFH